MSTISLWRTRWSAIGAAVAVTLGTGGIGITQATLGVGERTSFVPITPCRLADTRPAPFNRGPRLGPLGPNQTVTFGAWGPVGDCTITNQATGLVLNVTAVNQSLLTFLTIYPTGATRPETSNLNPSPGQPPTPNAVTVDLNGSGQFDIYNLQGSVDVIVDVVGYYEDHHHDDRYFTKDEVIGIARGAQWGEIPSGMTVTGSFEFQGYAAGNNTYSIQLPGIPPVALSSNTINFSPDVTTNTSDDDPTCTGTVTSPTAPAGKICLYLYVIGGLSQARGETASLPGAFLVRSQGTVGQAGLGFTYAYTAP
jgi:hypothetical protein